MRKPKSPRRTRGVWIGHTLLAVPDVEASKTFFLKLGLRHVETTDTVAILELRGGTHLILVPAKKPAAPGAAAAFDLMVDDLDATHAALMAAGLAPSAIEAGTIHRAFTVMEPGGHRITINSSHVSGRPV
jgi:catechol 2,3-dioxygenase-like lactoylglutathione lyase family enzyme